MTTETQSHRNTSSKSSTVSRFDSPATPAMACSYGHAIHEDCGSVRQRPRDAARLSGRNPGPYRLSARRFGLPDFVFELRHPHPRRPPDVLVGDEPGGAEDEHRRPRSGGLLIVDEDEFNAANLKKAAYKSTPRGRLARLLQVVPIPITRQNELALEGMPLNAQGKFKSRNFYALGIISGCTAARWKPPSSGRRSSFGRSRKRWKRTSARSRPATPTAKPRDVPCRYEVPPAEVAPGTYRHISGNEATALGSLPQRAERPATVLRQLPDYACVDILHELSKLRNFGVQDIPGRRRNRRHRRPLSAPPTAATSPSPAPAARAWLSRAKH